MGILHSEKDQLNNLIKVELLNLQTINQKLVSFKLGYYKENRLPTNYFYYIKALEREFQNNLEQLILILEDFHFNYNIKTLIQNPAQQTDLNLDYNLLKGSILALVQLIKFKFQLDLKINLMIIDGRSNADDHKLEDNNDSSECEDMENNLIIDDHIDFFNDLIENSTYAYSGLRKSFKTILNWNSPDFDLNGNQEVVNEKNKPRKLNSYINNHHSLTSAGIKSWFNKKLQSIH
ncbi:hypothetical protein CONCODRAFT_13049 [Conidiobolus coronatus NRRL 28638]|uniref:Uncharacterized protein n=1 Tax=Conidiobolus coronatus (strain ATCC 28846 / CBS 209.66 / NRRL 28638) TaxID=796925 RepID=A0A137NRH6_CONC2|nr:hypothetical protein CONCODRAFT_13049 [Conidiobolus coronatus NRRL 28638]|eukprot:KXN65376.1 hypothetical protein CONCODRAFT_13049 [Conidiobolus coronatus NRRL 28638]